MERERKIDGRRKIKGVRRKSEGKKGKDEGRKETD